MKIGQMTFLSFIYTTSESGVIFWSDIEKQEKKKEEKNA